MCYCPDRRGVLLEEELTVFGHEYPAKLTYCDFGVYTTVILDFHLRILLGITGGSFNFIKLYSTLLDFDFICFDFIDLFRLY